MATSTCSASTTSCASSPVSCAFVLVTEDLIRLIERSEAEAVSESARSFGGRVLHIAGGVAANCGQGNVMTQCAGCGLDRDITEAEFHALLDHFRDVEHFEFKLSVISGQATRAMVTSRAFTISEFETLLVRPLGEISDEADQLDMRPPVPGDELAYGARAAARFYSGSEPPPGLDRVIAASLARPGVYGFELFAEGVPIAGCALSVSGGVAWLAGASVDPAHRGRGLHKAMQAFRLRRATELGCTIAVQGAIAGSISQQNAQKNGFSIAFTRPTFLVSSHPRGEGVRR